MLLLENKSDTRPAGICQESGWLIGVVESHDRSPGKKSFCDVERLIVGCGPMKFILGAEERSQRCGGLRDLGACTRKLVHQSEKRAEISST